MNLIRTSNVPIFTLLLNRINKILASFQMKRFFFCLFTISNWYFTNYHVNEACFHSIIPSTWQLILDTNTQKRKKIISDMNNITQKNLDKYGCLMRVRNYFIKIIFSMEPLHVWILCISYRDVLLEKFTSKRNYLTSRYLYKNTSLDFVNNINYSFHSIWALNISTNILTTSY